MTEQSVPEEEIPQGVPSEPVDVPAEQEDAADNGDDTEEEETTPEQPA